MAKKKIFISSVQVELSAERKALHEYINADPLLGKFFEPFLFELLPAVDQRADELYLREVEHSDIYVGVLGKEYGSENAAGISPTELEFNHATKHHKTRLVFLTAHKNNERHPKEVKFISKVQDVLVRKKFTTVDELKLSVYAALVRYLEEKEIIRVGPFDASFNEQAKPADIDDEKVKQFVRIAQSKRGFPLNESEPTEKILTHLNLVQHHRISNAALLLFGKQPQRFFINSEVRCASFHGTIVEKPIPSYKVFKGTVFELVDEAVDFVLSKLDYAIGTRSQQTQIPGSYEIPKEVIREAIVNAIAHRDYTSNASVQVMLFKDRLEIWNPGSLPLGWTTEKLKQLHTSVPANPLLAQPMYLAGYIERLGTGTADMLRIAVQAGLKIPEFIQEEEFKIIVYRPTYHASTDQATDQPTDQATELVKRLVFVAEAINSRQQLMDLLGLKHIPSFRENYLTASLADGYIEPTIPETPNHPNQLYKLTEKGLSLKNGLLAPIAPFTPDDTMHDTMQDTMHDTMQVEQLVAVMEGAMTRDELQEKLTINNRDYFRKAYINEALNKEFIDMTLPDKPKSKNQKYRLTEKGKALQKKLKNKI